MNSIPGTKVLDLGGAQSTKAQLSPEAWMQQQIQRSNDFADAVRFNREQYKVQLAARNEAQRAHVTAVAKGAILKARLEQLLSPEARHTVEWGLKMGFGIHPSIAAKLADDPVVKACLS